MPLSGVRVLDLTRLLPGPYATLLLADLGADVIKVESPAKPDYLRFFPPPADRAFAILNRGKRSVMLPWDSEPETLRRLAGTCDVFVESFRSGYLKRFGLDAESLLGEHPRLIYCSMSGYGQGDSRAGHDLNFIARAGLASQLGRAVPRVQLADMSGGMTAAMAILAALVERNRTGRGRHLDVALADGPMAFTLLQQAGIDMEVLGGRAPGYRYYRCQDDLWLSVGALEEGFQRKMAEALEIPDEGWLDLDGPLHQTLEERFASAPREHWLALFGPLDCCVEPVLDPTEVKARAEGLLGASFPPGPRQGVAEPGQHTEEVLREAGRSLRE